MKPLGVSTLAVFTCLWVAASLSSVHAQSPFVSPSLCFDGIDDQVRVPFSPLFPTQVFTVSAWVKVAEPPSNLPFGAVIVTRGDDDVSDNLPWDLRIFPSGTFVLGLEDSNDFGQSYDSGVVVTDGLWHFVTATREASGTAKLYVDGALRGTFSTITPSSNNSQILTIGCIIGSLDAGPQSPIFFLKGGIDEVAFWDRALSDAEILSVFNSGVVPTSPGLRGYYRLDASGQQVLDSSPSNNNGSLGTTQMPDSADPTRIPPVPAAEVPRLGSPANPMALLPGATSGPIIGRTWDPFIDHTSFLPGAVIDVLGVSLVSPGAINMPTPLGTLLCDISVPPLTFMSTPGTPFSIPIPDNCNLVGAQLCTQGVSGDLNTIVLTNALDITIGTF